ncbi:hypothetical protein [Pseudomonas sp. ADPe]|uniref:hypothetical protein n=1 Tax=unclassified Pseudomonas TaxID=196821 RepID=UPI00072FF355|nr:hypothetical protein [Pseudomonas sp. ADPe]QOF84674.1 hypothetical protein IG194_29845 [Pseudomonas sp. ADPe]QOF84685.1 hypothetical protein IG194_29905 [Pseudomonas sp. ADPe]QOF84696.1 hypothetical protein IG194_29965 [Pseudomonas sp. ADPe]
MTLEYILTILLQSNPTPTTVITVHTPYPTKEACTTAGKAMAAAEKATRKTDKNYLVYCRGVIPKAAPEASKNQG